MLLWKIDFAAQALAHRKSAQGFRIMAGSAAKPDIQDELLRVAEGYDLLANECEIFANS